MRNKILSSYMAEFTIGNLKLENQKIKFLGTKGCPVHC